MKLLPMLPSDTPVLSPADVAELQDEVRALAAERNATILAHNYQLPEVQDVADYVGDSLGLSRQGAKTDATSSPSAACTSWPRRRRSSRRTRRSSSPTSTPGCSLADSITPDQLRAWQAKHPAR
jgi:quinolinate synthase